jgi:two-component sensor histidine kinase
MFPALLLATYFGGAAGGASCLGLTLLAAWYLFLGTPRSFSLAPHEGADLLALLVSGGAIVGGVMSIRQLIQELGQAHERERQLARELQHRVKNNLAVVEGLVAQSARGAADLDAFLEEFLPRMKSLSAAQVVLSGFEDDDVPIDSVISIVLAPFAASQQLSWSGEAIKVTQQQAVALALCLHELATNSVKYGALSTSAGSVRIAWRRLSARLNRIEWKERGGPPLRQIRRSGSGTRLLRRGLEPARPAELAYAPEGVVWAADFSPAA